MYAFELPEKHRDYTGKRYLKHGGLVQVVFYNKLSLFVSELPEKDISNMVV